MFSRWMPPYEEPGRTSWVAFAVLVLLAAASVWYLAHHLMAAAIGAASVGLVCLVRWVLHRRTVALARARRAEDIGTFARAFDRRAPTFDPWVVRAVWDALVTWTDLGRHGRLPLRPSDVIAELGCVDDDLDDVLLEAATRARRRLDETRSNPYFDRVITVGDLVAFISHQPRIEDAGAGIA